MYSIRIAEGLDQIGLSVNRGLGVSGREAAAEDGAEDLAAGRSRPQAGARGGNNMRTIAATERRERVMENPAGQAPTLRASPKQKIAGKTPSLRNAQTRSAVLALVPAPGGRNDFTQIGVLGHPAQRFSCLGRGRHEHGRIARAARDD